MISELLWGSYQQIHLLFYSALVGFGMGVGFDITNGVGRSYTNARRFISDVLFCCFAAVVTFFTSLVLNHGHLHPVLILGIFAGVLIEHKVIGRFVSEWFHCLIQYVADLFREMRVIFRKLLLFLLRRIRFRCSKIKKYKKSPQKRAFFKKKT